MAEWPHGRTELPSPDMMRPFGCTVFSHLEKTMREGGDKLSPISEPGVMVGYSDRMKAWKVYFPHRNKVPNRFHLRFKPASTMGRRPTATDARTNGRGGETEAMSAPADVGSNKPTPDATAHSPRTQRARCRQRLLAGASLRTGGVSFKHVT